MSEPTGKGGEDALRLEGVRAGYDGPDVLRGVDLTFRRGELTGIIGPNGAGKTTLFRAATGSLPVREGRVLFSGRMLGEIKAGEIARRVALTPQVLDVPFSFTVEEFVGMGRLPHLGRFTAPGEADRREVRRSMALVDLLPFSSRLLQTLSGGERQRAVIAQALAQEPDVLLLDEPAAHLDVNHQVEVFELLLAIRSRGPAVVAILHDLNLASEYCERVILVEEGRIAGDGPPEEVITTGNLASAFGLTLDVSPDPLTRRPAVRYRRTPPASADVDRPKVHVVCGGGSGATLLRRLHFEGFRVSTGVLNEGDSDASCAQWLGIPVVLEAPFHPVGEAATAKAQALMEEAEAVIVCGVAMGPGNVGNLEVIDSSMAGRVIFVDLKGEWDFTGGRARSLLESLRRAGALPVGSDREAFEALRERVRGCPGGGASS